MKPGVVEDYSRSMCFVAKPQNGKYLSMTKINFSEADINKHLSSE
jgi:hypothetical protein